MDKIKFFNDVMKVHDTKNNKYNEKVADLILSKRVDEFNIYYEIYERLKEKYNICPFHFILKGTKDKNIERNLDDIVKFTFKVDEKDIDSIYVLLNKEASIFHTEYCSSHCKFTKKSSNGIIFVEITEIERNVDLNKATNKQEEK